MVPFRIHIFKKRSIGLNYTNVKPEVNFLVNSGLVCAFLFVIIGSVFLDKAVFLKKERSYYVPPLNYLLFISATHKHLFADMFFIRGVLDLSEEFPPGFDRLGYLLKNFEIATTLDPKLTRGYFFAGIVSPVKKEQIPQCIQFLKQGIKRDPDSWQIPFWIGFNYFQIGNYGQTIEYYQTAASLAGAPGYLKTNLAFYYYQAGYPQLGLLYFESLLDSVKDKRITRMIEQKIKWLKDIVFLEGKVKEFKQKYGRWPKDLEELVSKRLIEKIPDDPFGKGYYLSEEWYKEPAKVKSRFDNKLLTP